MKGNWWWKDMEMIRKSIDMADEILKELDIKDYIVPLDNVIDYIENKHKVSIKTYRVDFPEALNEYGAFIKMTKISDKLVANIFINSLKKNEFQRFSLAHELGHLLFRINDLEDGETIVSTHISEDLDYISKEAFEKNNFLKEEQIANVFALELLMPKNKFKRTILESSSPIEVAKKFDVSNTAVFSRIEMLLNDGR